MCPPAITLQLPTELLVFRVEQSVYVNTGLPQARSSTRCTRIPTAASGPAASRSIRLDPNVTLSLHAPAVISEVGENIAGTATESNDAGNAQFPSRTARRMVPARREKLNESAITKAPSICWMASSRTPDG